jgi:hypothetical protein
MNRSEETYLLTGVGPPDRLVLQLERALASKRYHLEPRGAAVAAAAAPRARSAARWTRWLGIGLLAASALAGASLLRESGGDPVADPPLVQQTPHQDPLSPGETAEAG